MNAVSLAMLVFAVLTLAHMLREREPGYGDLGAGLAVTGTVLAGMFVGIEAVANELASSSIDPSAAAAVLSDAESSPVETTAIVGSLALAVGLLVLAVGLFRARAVPVVSAVGLGLFAVGLIVAYGASLSVVLIVSFVLLTLALVPVGWQVLRESDQAWDHTPRYHGFRAQPV